MTGKTGTEENWLRTAADWIESGRPIGGEFDFADRLRHAATEIGQLRQSVALRDAAYDHQIMLTENEMENRERYRQALVKIRELTFNGGGRDREISKVIREALDGR